MLTKIKKAISDYQMLEKGDNVIVALSGGADSVALFHALNSLSEELGIEISACHLNHNLRGAESFHDEDFVRSICENAKVPLTVKSVNVMSLQQKHQSIEQCAREARYEFFGEICGNSKIATAHTASDNTETVLLNIIRGSALKGLCGIPAVRGNIIRPLINCSRKEIEAYCLEQNLSFVTDSTNLSDEYTRNRIRLNIIPLLEELNPSLTTGISRMCTQLRLEDKFLSDIADEIISKSHENGKYKVDILMSAPDCLLGRIIAAVLYQNNISPSSLMVREIEKILKIGAGKINIKKHTFVIVRKNFMYFECVLQNYKNISINNHHS